MISYMKLSHQERIIMVIVIWDGEPSHRFMVYNTGSD
jgi:hypothetical protein